MVKKKKKKEKPTINALLRAMEIYGLDCKSKDAIHMSSEKAQDWLAHLYRTGHSEVCS